MTAARRLEVQATVDLVNWIRSHLGFTYSQLALVAGATTRTAQRWGDPKDATIPRAEHRARLERLRDLKRLLAGTFPSEAVAQEWLHREVPLLEHRRPIDLIRRGEFTPVIEVLAGAHSGAFA